MKYLLLTLLVCFSLMNSNAQAPQGIPYQSVIRNGSGALLINQAVNVRFSIHDSTAMGTIVYQETHTTTTSNLGMITLSIGQGTPSIATFSSINWGSGAKFMQVELDASGGNNYIDLGTQQMMSVPYALYAGNTQSSGIKLGYGQSGSWLCPTGVTHITVELWGGGGGGAGAECCYQGTPIAPGGNGGSGGYVKVNVNVNPGQIYFITVGSGGSAPSWNGYFGAGDGGNGGNTSFSGLAVANGGEGGKMYSINGQNASITNWQYSNYIPLSNVSYIPTGFVQNPPTGVASGGLGARYCGYSFIACGPTAGENGFCILTY